MSLSQEDIAIVEAARAELREMPLPPAMGQWGCLAAVAGVLVLIVWPPLLDAAPSASFFTPFAMLFAIVAVVGGPVVLLTGGHSGRNAARAAIEASLRVLEDPDVNREEFLRAATVLLDRAYVSQGPSTDRMVDPIEARARVGDRIELVLEVERHFVAEYDDWPVFGAPDASGE